MRVTIDQLAQGLYASYLEHRTLADFGMRRYHPFSFDFDSTPHNLEEPEDEWDPVVKDLHLKNRERTLAWLKEMYGAARQDIVIQNFRDLGSKPFSLIASHNSLHQQAREAFLIGSYYPALVSACALGERILNHLILDLREDYRHTPVFRKVHRKSSFSDWERAVSILNSWDVLIQNVGADFLALFALRNRSVHFNAETYQTQRDDALSALKHIGLIVSKQFGFFGRQPWFIGGTAGAQFIKREYESHPFVRVYLLPRSGFIGPSYGMDYQAGRWRHLDYSDYGDGSLADDGFAKAYAERDPESVVSTEMLLAQIARRDKEKNP